MPARRSGRTPTGRSRSIRPRRTTTESCSRRSAARRCTASSTSSPSTRPMRARSGAPKSRRARGARSRGPGACTRRRAPAPEPHGGGPGAGGAGRGRAGGGGAGARGGGAGPLLLVGRSGAATPAAEQAIADLRARGADVRVCKVDLADRAALEKLLKDSAAELPPLRGIMHAAGVLKDGLLARLEWPDFDRVLMPKVQGTLHLDELTRGLPLDFFVLFSSISGIGAPGQCNYAPTN